jgi:hypothetical protein
MLRGLRSSTGCLAMIRGEPDDGETSELHSFESVVDLQVSKPAAAFIPPNINSTAAAMFRNVRANFICRSLSVLAAASPYIRDQA